MEAVPERPDRAFTGWASEPARNAQAAAKQRNAASLAKDQRLPNFWVA